MTHRLLATGLLTLVLAAGCGGDDESSATTAWAGDVCSALSSWNEAVVAVVESVGPGSGGDGVEAAVDDLAEATSTLGDDLRALGPPDTEAGNDAQQALDDLAAAADEAVTQVQTEVEGASGPAGLAQAAASVGAALSALGQELSTTFNELEQVDPGGELEDAFAEAEACDDLRESGS